MRLSRKTSPSWTIGVLQIVVGVGEEEKVYTKAIKHNDCDRFIWQCWLNDVIFIEWHAWLKTFGQVHAKSRIAMKEKPKKRRRGMKYIFLQYNCCVILNLFWYNLKIFISIKSNCLSYKVYHDTSLMQIPRNDMYHALGTI